ncbi:type III polyketide synthase [Brevibacillus humidisoli]|uniref:type III polyketide synthase n=1 Tax=Brevibacillus humidisoli TaxID=2895522 RepID=UPI001E509B77|nr:3-oxoacyl-[acyl-carrier-protein] synthase III C-terminal domain-containing protein [Brevibacillus humidisoli]UFJ39234.1 type III polyketide synthase [Brevibacillus humidisoli]
MPHILSVGKAVPPYEISQEESMRLVYHLFRDRFPQIDRLMKIFPNTEIRTRRFCMPPEWFLRDHRFAEKNKQYVDNACRLGSEAINQCLETNGLAPEEIDCLIYVSSTGIATPSIDARILNLLGMREDIARIPIWGLGCVAGAMGISRACDYAKAHPDQLVLLLSVELCGLTFVKRDVSKSNFIATSLFADGAAAVLVAGDEYVRSHPTFHSTPMIVGSATTTWRDSLDVMGWDVTDDGLRVIFSRDIPTLVKQRMRQTVDQALQRYGLTLSQISRYIPHPGGAKVVAAYRETLELTDESTRDAEEVLSSCGNMSSATVLYVLERSLKQPWAAGEYGLLTALGPGFSSEVVILQAGGCMHR